MQSDLRAPARASPFGDYRVAGWRIRQLDGFARRALSALAEAGAAETRLSDVRDGGRPAVFDASYYEDEVDRTRAALRDGARQLAEWSLLRAAAMPVPAPANPTADGEGEPSAAAMSRLDQRAPPTDTCR